MEAVFDCARRFHAQPLDAKMAVKLDDAMQGYLPYKSSTTRANGLVAVRKPNENEAFFVVPEREPGTPANRWPVALPDFGPTTMACFAALEALALRMLPIYARAVELPADYFDRLCSHSLSTLRLTHYPAVAYGQDEYGIAPHTDSTFFTLLAQNAQPGLQLRKTDGSWIDVPVIPDSFVVNTGDVLNRWTNGRFLSTPHRAFNLGSGPRYAVPFFFHPNPETLIECLPTCTDAAHPPRFPPQTVGDYMAWFRTSNYDHFREKAPAAAAE
jgi:isopenicillin N synthase-like dioxygenase